MSATRLPRPPPLRARNSAAPRMRAKVAACGSSISKLRAMALPLPAKHNRPDVGPNHPTRVGQH